MYKRTAHYDKRQVPAEYSDKCRPKRPFPSSYLPPLKGSAAYLPPLKGSEVRRLNRALGPVQTPHFT